MTITTKIGIAIIMTNIVLKTFNSWLARVLRFIGSVQSITSISFENLFRILPRGLLSKKCIGALITLISILS